MNIRKKVGKYFDKHTCVKCKVWLSRDDLRSNCGICPQCGHQGWSGFVAEHDTEVIRKVEYQRKGRWFWSGWKTIKTVYEKAEDDEN